MRCRKAEELLLARANSAPPDPALLEHLAGCAACRAQETAWTRALGALEAAPGPAPDLWPKFQVRLAAEVDCQAAREQLPAYAEGALAGAMTLAMQAHLARCAACAAEEKALARSLRTLERSAPAEAPDLWPALAARLAASQPAPKHARAFRLPAWLGSGPAWRPSLALAGVALLVVALRGPFPLLAGGARVAAPPEAKPGPLQARISPTAPLPDLVPPTAPTHVASVAVTRHPDSEARTPQPAHPRVGRARRELREGRVRRLRTPLAPVIRERDVEAPARRAPTVRAHEELMAAAPPLPVPEATLTGVESPTDLNSEAAQARIMPATVQMAAMFAKMESSVKQPFQEVEYDAGER